MPGSRPLLVALALAAASTPTAALAQCVFTTGPTPVSFGSYNPAAAVPTDTTSSFTFNCKGNPGNTVALSAGAGTFAQRQMTLAGGGDVLYYNLYQDAARSIIWGDGTPPSQVDAVDYKKTLYYIYGRIPAGQWVTAGTYSDNIVITLNY